MAIGSDGVQGQPSSTSRRDALKRGAVVGGLLWVTPAVQMIGISPAHAQSTSPGGGGVDLKGISFIEFSFTCEGTLHYAKIDTIDSPTSFDCEGPSHKGAHCGVSRTGAANGCGKFTLSDLVYDDGDLVRVTVNLTCTDADFVAGRSKCGQECVVQSVSGTSAMFFGCPKL